MYFTVGGVLGICVIWRNSPFCRDNVTASEGGAGYALSTGNALLARI